MRALVFRFIFDANLFLCVCYVCVFPSGAASNADPPRPSQMKSSKTSCFRKASVARKRCVFFPIPQRGYGLQGESKGTTKFPQIPHAADHRLGPQEIKDVNHVKDSIPNYIRRKTAYFDPGEDFLIIFF